MQKPKRKFDLVFLIFLMVLLWSIASQLIQIALTMPFLWREPSAWARLIATSVAVYGLTWIVRIYAQSVKAQKNDKDK